MSSECLRNLPPETQCLQPWYFQSKAAEQKFTEQAYQSKQAARFTYQSPSVPMSLFIISFPEVVSLPLWFISSSHMLSTEIGLCTSCLISEESENTILP